MKELESIWSGKTFISPEKKKNDIVELYPNPVKSSMTIVFKNEFSQNALIRIYKIGFGEMVFESKINGKSTTLDLSGLSTGLYIILPKFRTVS